MLFFNSPSFLLYHSLDQCFLNYFWIISSFLLVALLPSFSSMSLSPFVMHINIISGQSNWILYTSLMRVTTYCSIQSFTIQLIDTELLMNTNLQFTSVLSLHSVLLSLTTTLASTDLRKLIINECIISKPFFFLSNWTIREKLIRLYFIFI